jgi:hypothetical protein
MNEKPTKFRLATLIIAFGLLLLIPIGVFAHYVAAEPKAQATPPVEAVYPGPRASAVHPSHGLSTPVPFIVQALWTYQKALKGKNLSEEGRQSLETKVAMYGGIATQIAKAEKAPPNPVPRPTHELRHFPTPALLVGLFEGGTSDFNSFEAIIHNRWVQFVSNYEYIIVYAGELGSATDYPGRGVIFVLTATNDTSVSHTSEYMLPEGTGWVRISEVKGDYLILTSKEGNTFYFYIPGQQLVPSLMDIAPTVTPLPTSRPLPTVGASPTETQPPAYPLPSSYPGP